MPAVSPIVIMNESTIDCHGVSKTISPWCVDDVDDDDDDELLRIVIRLVWLSDDDEWEDDDDELLISYASNMS